MAWALNINALTRLSIMKGLLRDFMLFSVTFTLATSASLPLSTHYVQVTKPHVVFMLVDDWGWTDVGYHQTTQTQDIVTLNIDSLVEVGLQLDQHYVYNYCSPLRAALLSGRLPIHVNDIDSSQSCYNLDDSVSGYSGIPRNMTVISAKMKEAGYATHQVGKRDACMATPDHTAKGRGFDSSLNYFHHAMATSVRL